VKAYLGLGNVAITRVSIASKVVDRELIGAVAVASVEADHSQNTVTPVAATGARPKSVGDFQASGGTCVRSVFFLYFRWRRVRFQTFPQSVR